jgi:hypothetical protein
MSVLNKTKNACRASVLQVVWLARGILVPGEYLLLAGCLQISSGTCESEKVGSCTCQVVGDADRREPIKQGIQSKGVVEPGQFWFSTWIESFKDEEIDVKLGHAFPPG